MTNADVITAEFERKVCRGVRLISEGKARYRVFTPFSFDDGDLVSVVLRAENGGWVLTDEGNTYMRLSYTLDDRALQADGRRKVIENALAAGQVEDRNGELVSSVEDANYGDALFSLVQAVLRITDVSLQTREQVRSNFAADVRAFVERVVPLDRRTRGWHEPGLDPDARYPIDWFVRTPEVPVFLFALQTEDKVKDATIVLHQFEKWKYNFRTVGIFQDQQEISARTLARFTDVAEKNFSAFAGNEDRIERYLSGLLSPYSGPADA